MMEPLISPCTSSPGCDKTLYEVSQTANASEGASRRDICEALSEMGSPRPARTETPSGFEWACAGATAGDSEEIQLLRSQIKRIAPHFRTALVTGIQGTCKEGVARLLHGMSSCAGGEFIAYEATALAEEIGQGDRTPADSALGATLYLNEIGEVPVALQGALLKLWSNTSRSRMRLIAGTHRDLRTMSVTGQFRQDLAQRLTGIELCIPPLRARRADLPATLDEVLRAVGGERELRLSADARDRLFAHTWAGDVAELNEVIRSAANAAGRRSLIEAGYLPELRAEEPSPEEEAGMEKLQDVVRQHVLNVLTRCGGNKLRAAEILGISRSTLYRMLDSVSNGFAAG